MKKQVIWHILLTVCLSLCKTHAQQTVTQEQISHLNNAEVPKGSKLRAQLFDIARPEIEQAAGCQVRFVGSMVRDREAVDFKGKVINSKDQPIRFNGSELVGVRWKLSNNTWRVYELNMGNSIQSKITSITNSSYSGLDALKTDAIINVDIKKEKENSILESEKEPAVKTILQERPDQIDSATINCKRNIIALNRENIIYFYEISSENLIKKVELNGSQIRRIFFKKGSNNLYYYRISPQGGIDVYLYRYSDNGISKVNHYEADEVIGYDENRDVFALMKEQGKGSDRAIDWITEVSPESGSVLSKKHFNPESDLSTQLSGSYDKNEKLSVVQITTEEDRPGVLIKLSEYSGEENSDFLKNDVLSRIVENLKLPNEVGKADRNKNQYNNYIYLNKLKINIDESFKISRQRDLIISSGGGIKYAINKNGFWETHEIPTTEKRITGITASYYGKNIFAWSVLNVSFVSDPNGKLLPMFENGEVDPNLQLDINQKNSSSSFIYDFGSFQYKKNEFDTNDIISASFSDDGLNLGFRDAEISKMVQSDDFKMKGGNLGTPPVNSYYGVFNIKHNQITNLVSVPTFPFGSHAIGGFVDLSFLVNDGSIVFNNNFYKQYATKNKLTIDSSNNGSITENEKSGFRTEIGYELTKKRGYISKDYINKSINKNGEEVIWKSSVGDLDARSTKTLVQASTGDGKNISSFYINAAIDSAYPLKKNKILISIPQDGLSVIDTSANKIIACYTNNIISEGNWTWFRMPNPQRLAITENFFYFLENSGKIAILHWDDSNNKFTTLPSLYPQSSGPPVFLDFDGYYSTASKSIKGVHFTDGQRTYPLEQFDLRLNRPDIVLQRLGAPKEAIEASKTLREKRLKKMNVTEEMLQPDFHLPEISLTSEIPATTSADQIDLKIKATDDKYPLDRLRVYVNNVPINGTEGESLRDQKTQSLEKTIPIKLAAGRNKIQISVLNSAGAESLYANAEVTCTAQRPKPTLYVVSMGVSQYANPDNNLKYAAKDAEDLAKKLKDRAGSLYGEVKELVLKDQDVSKENLTKVRDFLKPATIDDSVVLFMAGHGLLDEKYDYYFGTSDIDPAHPEQRGIPFEEMDEILASLPCLKKSMLVDTCHAGELDADEKKQLAASDASAQGVPVTTDAGNGAKVAMRAIGARGMQVKAVEGSKGRNDWYERLQDMFVDLRRGSGSTILSSSEGAEYAYESSDQQNGLFTYALMEALDGKGHPADAKSPEVTMSEVAEYVKKRVGDLTNHKQTPNARRVNLEGDFALGTAK